MCMICLRVHVHIGINPKRLESYEVILFIHIHVRHPFCLISGLNITDTWSYMEVISLNIAAYRVSRNHIHISTCLHAQAHTLDNIQMEA